MRFDDLQAYLLPRKVPILKSPTRIPRVVKPQAPLRQSRRKWIPSLNREVPKILYREKITVILRDSIYVSVIDIVSETECGRVRG